MSSNHSGKAVEIPWLVTPFRSNDFVEALAPYAELAINYGAKGYLVIRQADDELTVKQYAFFENKADWERYWNSEAMITFRAEMTGHYVVPLLYTWQNIITHGHITEDSEEAAAAASIDV